MAQFPKLKTGAVSQYPTEKVLERSGEAHRFLDQSEQRFRDSFEGRRRWKIRLSLLDDSELAELRELFIERRGRAGTFDFEDPMTGLLVTNCRFGSDRFGSRSQDETDSVTEVEVIEGR